ncbi:MAG: non-homologous end-joining DNA ligase [Actinobacteria bacterium]|nr:non-homologous end-joining DNA ligase [Actinomycetota bacterium]
MEVTNSDRVVFPADGITKGDVFDYYGTVADSLLPYITDRALTVERYPKGIGADGFMQKNAPDHYPDFIGRHETPKEGGGTTVYPVVHDTDGILYYANLGVITFHAPPVRVADPSHPDWVVWDLDPPPGRVDLAREAARLMRDVIEGHGLRTWVMTSGSKGYHLRALLRRDLGADEVAGVARGLGALASAAKPDLATLAFLKKERAGRVFIDWLRNAPYSTAVAPWSLRPRDGAPVAAPLDWEELSRVPPDGIRLGDVGERLATDPWAGIEGQEISATASAVAESLDAAGIVLEPFDRFRP